MNVVHSAFDLLAALSAIGVSFLCIRWRLSGALERIGQGGTGYALSLIIGAVVGGYGLGSANLYLGGEIALARSVLGALAGAIVGVEVYKHFRGMRGSTGIVFVPAFATSVAVGRIGCFLSGIEDRTYGISTSLPWGHDFGDGLNRHPVQLYESAVMAAFLGVTLVLIGRRSPFFLRNGFYLLVFVYSGQRFVWEFLKPYSLVLGPFNIFQLVCLGLIAYAVKMMMSDRSLARV